MLESAIAYLQHADPLAIYVFLFLIAFLENVIPPIPGDVPVAFIGYLINFSRVSFWWAVISSSIGSLAGFMMVFLLSRSLGLKLYSEGEKPVSHRLSRVVHRFFPPSEMAEIRRKFAAHGYLSVLVNRFFFGSRAVISVMAGLMHLKILPVFINAAISATLWNIMLIYGGFFLGSRWMDIGRYAALYSIPVTLLFLSVVFFSLWRFIRERKRTNE
ncbi:MAG: DedA family protein [Chlorobiaceae bacterium]|nr:DedA family protein [Chlorobiaceae bacterium]